MTYCPSRSRFVAVSLSLLSSLPLVLAPALVHAQGPEAPLAQAPIVVGEHTCYVGEHAGVDDAEARTTTDLVCTELAPVKAPAGIYDVRLGKLGSRVLLGITARGSGVSRRVLIQSLDEVPVASRRLVAALVDHKSVEETQNVDNVVASDSRKLKSKSLATSAEVGLVGVTAVGVAPNASAAAAVGVAFRSGRVSFGSHFRGGGAGSSSNKLVFLSIDVGARYHFSDADTALFVGGGFTLSDLKINRDPIVAPAGSSGSGHGYSYGYPSTADLSPSGSGFGGYVEGGVEILRSSHVGAMFSFRADAPFFVLKADDVLGYGSSAQRVFVSRYVVPLSVTLGFSFR